MREATTRTAVLSGRVEGSGGHVIGNQDPDSTSEILRAKIAEVNEDKRIGATRGYGSISYFVVNTVFCQAPEGVVLNRLPSSDFHGSQYSLCFTYTHSFSFAAIVSIQDARLAENEFR